MLRAYDQFHAYAIRHAWSILSNLTEVSNRDIDQIFQDAGDTLSQHIGSSGDRRAMLIDRIQAEPTGDLAHSYLYWLENHGMSAMGTSMEFQDYLADMDANGLEPHTVPVFVFDRIVQGDYEPSDAPYFSVKVKGKYVVTHTRIYPLKPTIGSDTPGVVQAIKFIHLEPIGARPDVLPGD
jgi:hypothetical protein